MDFEIRVISHAACFLSAVSLQESQTCVHMWMSSVCLCVCSIINGFTVNIPELSDMNETQRRCMSVWEYVSGFV